MSNVQGTKVVDHCTPMMDCYYRVGDRCKYFEFIGSPEIPSCGNPEANTGDGRKENCEECEQEYDQCTCDSEIHIDPTVGSTRDECIEYFTANMKVYTIMRDACTVSLEGATGELRKTLESQIYQCNDWIEHYKELLGGNDEEV